MGWPPTDSVSQVRFDRQNEFLWTAQFGANGIRLSRDNTPIVDRLGTLELFGGQTVGQVQILAHDAINSGAVTVTDHTLSAPISVAGRDDPTRMG
ncbi:hypothetical protein [Halocatena halophila]|uniref:hypothetical protein n=1 Tax=Halocatena halophila TaxID=2814576 RepID=UPI002ED1356E